MFVKLEKVSCQGQGPQAAAMHDAAHRLQMQACTSLHQHTLVLLPFAHPAVKVVALWPVGMYLLRLGSSLKAKL